jgi:ABC-2 type transport system permease protein
MRNILLVARREYLEQIRSRAFKISTVALPLMIAALLAFSYYMDHKAGTGKHIVIVADNASLANQVRQQMLEDKHAQYKVEVAEPAAEDQRDAWQRKVRAKAIDGVLTIDSSKPQKITATFTSLSVADVSAYGSLQSALNRGVFNQRMIARGVSQADADALLAKVPIEVLQLDKEGKIGKSNGNAIVIKATLMLIMLSVPIMLYGLDMARAIIEEKTSRIFEVMLAIAKPGDMLAGKLIGVGAVGLTQIAIWAAAGGAIAGSAFAGPILSGTLSIHFTWVEGVLFPLYFVLGYLLNASLFAGLAATCETEQELQMYTPLAALPIWISFGLIMLVVNNPDSALSIAASLFPFTAPIIMMLRMGSQIPPAWQFAASIGIMIASIWATLWFSSRLYRVGILMYGKRATLPEILRWVRYS